MRNRSPAFHAIGLTVLAMACFAAMSTCIRALAGEVPSTQMVLLRNVLSLCMMAALIGWQRKSLFETARLRGHMLRASLGFFAMELWFYGLTLLPVTLATALSFTTPVFGTMAAMWLLKEHAGWRRWSAIAVSFVGVLVILRPGMEGVSPAAGVVLVSSCLMALSGVAVKSLTRTEPPETIVFYMALFMTPLSLPLGVWAWQPVSAHAWLLITAIAFGSTLAQLLMARAFKQADMVTLLPFDFLRLVFTAALAYLWFGEVLDGWTLAGAGIILASAVYIVHREAVRRKGMRDERDEG